MEIQRVKGLIRTRQRGSGSWIFSIPQGPGDYEIARTRRRTEGPISQVVLTNHRCVIDATHPESDHYLISVTDAEKGCVLLILLNVYGELVEIPGGKGRPASRGYAAFIFDGVSWGEWRKPHDVAVHEDGSGEVLLSVRGGNGVVVQADSYKDDWFLLTTAHVLNYSIGDCSIADLLALDQEGRRRDKDKERREMLEEALRLARSLKGAVNSNTAASIVRILQEVLHPF